MFLLRTLVIVHLLTSDISYLGDTVTVLGSFSVNTVDDSCDAVDLVLV